MIALLLAWLAVAPAPQPTAPVSLDVRVFDGTTEVTEQTRVTLYTAGSRTEPRQLPLAPNGERQLALPTGRYDVQLLHLDDGKVLRVRWTSLRLLVGYPGAHDRHLEVFNLQPGYGALQVRRAGATAELGTVRWKAALREAGGGNIVAPPQPADGYLLFIAQPGTYDLEITTADGATQWLRGLQVVADLTYLHTWGSSAGGNG